MNRVQEAAKLEEELRKKLEKRKNKVLEEEMKKILRDSRKREKSNHGQSEN